MKNYISHAMRAIWYALVGSLGWPTMAGRLTQYHRAQALPNWAVSFNQSLSALSPVDISVVITCFNYGDYLESAVNSVVEAALFNKHLKIEVLIFDDCSTDESFKVANYLLKSCPLPISIIRPWWNVGVSKGRNLCLPHARGDFIFILDADNTLSNDGLTNLYNYAITQQSDAAYGPIRRIMLDGKQHSLISNAPFDLDILRKQGNYIDAMALFRRSTLSALGGYDVNLLKVIGGWEDYDLWLRLASNEFKVSFCKSTIIGNYLFKPNSMAKAISYKEIVNGLNLLRTSAPALQFKPNKKLVFDFGFHLGEDTAYYLALGFNVVAIEADPDLYSLGLKKFAKEVDDKRLILVNAAVVSSKRFLKQSKISFFPHSKNTLWGTVDIDFVNRNTTVHKLPHDPEIEVDTISLEEVVEKYDCPSFIKIDIEGMDAEVVEDLERLPVMPQFVSWETGKKSLRRVLYTHLRLFGLGYRRFRIVQQMYSPIHFSAHNEIDDLIYPMAHSSGPIPSQHTSSWVGIFSVMLTYTLLFCIYKLIGPRSIFSWAEHHTSTIVNTIPRYLLKEIKRRHIPFPGWFDSHAALPEK